MSKNKGKTVVLKPPNSHYTLQDVWGTREALPKLFTLSQNGMTARYSIQMVRLFKALQPELETISQTYNALVVKYAKGAKDDKGNPLVALDSSHFLEFNKELTEVLSQEVTLNITPAKLPSSLIIDARTLLDMGPFVEVEN